MPSPHSDVIGWVRAVIERRTAARLRQLAIQILRSCGVLGDGDTSGDTWPVRLELPILVLNRRLGNVVLRQMSDLG